MEDTPATTALPDDPAILKSIILRLSSERDQATRRCDEATRKAQQLQARNQQIELQKQQLELQKQQIELEKLRLEMQLLRLKKWHYGPRADTLASSGQVNQMLLDFAESLDARPVDPKDLPEEATPAEATTLRRVRRGRRHLAAFNDLPVSRSVHDLPEDQKPCPCCGRMRQKIGEESSWQIEYIPGRFERLEHVRIKYACRHCEAEAQNPQITLAERPAQPIEKGLAGPGLLAYVVSSKFADYLPLYRLEGIFQRNGFEIERATQSLWCRDVAELIRPLYQRMIERLLQSHVVATDDTVMPMQAAGKARQARMWVYVGDEEHPYNLFDFTLSRSRDGPASFLRDYQQVLLADGYGGYDGVVVNSGITRAGCWAHARRKFVEAQKTHPAIAQAAVERIGRLYAVEQEAKGVSPPQRLGLRQARSLAVLMELHGKLLGWKDQLLPKHPMAEAVGYALNQWAQLNVFAWDGAVPIDNNVSERQMKRIVLNRKNSLFVGNERGGQTAAILSSITSTCRRHDIDPQRYLTQLLVNLPGTPLSQLDQWLPDVWKTHQTPPPGV